MIDVPVAAARSREEALSGAAARGSAAASFRGVLRVAGDVLEAGDDPPAIGGLALEHSRAEEGCTAPAARRRPVAAPAGPANRKLRDRTRGARWHSTPVAGNRGGTTPQRTISHGRRRVRPEQLFEPVVTPWHQCNNYYF